jgi:hypothetical protein
MPARNGLAFFRLHAFLHCDALYETDVALHFTLERNPAIAISGIELMHRIRNGQFDFHQHEFQTGQCACCLEEGALSSLSGSAYDGV